MWVKVPDCTLPEFRVGNYLRVGGSYGAPLKLMLISDCKPQYRGAFLVSDLIYLEPFTLPTFVRYARRESREACYMLRDLCQGFVIQKPRAEEPTGIAGVKP